MCDGCQEFFKKHAGVVKAAALATPVRLLITLTWRKWSLSKCSNGNKSKLIQSKCPGFLYTIASNLAISEWRKCKREAQLEPQHLDVYENRIDPDKGNKSRDQILVDQIMSKVKDPRTKMQSFPGIRMNR